MDYEEKYLDDIICILGLTLGVVLLLAGRGFGKYMTGASIGYTLKKRGPINT